MAAKNFIVKNGLTVGTTEVIDSSADLTAAAFGTAAKEAIDDQVNTLLTAGTGMAISYDDAAGTLTLTAADVGDITGVTAGNGLSGGGTSGAVTVALDLNELSAATVDVANDSVVIVDATDNSSKKEAVADVVSGIAGSGLSATSGVLAVGTLNQDTTGTAAIGTSVTVTANNSTDETVYPLFVDGATGTQGAETDTGFTYNPSTGVITATQLTGNVTGTLTGTASSIANHDTADLTEGTNLYHTTARARAAISAGGDLSYNSSTGVMSFTNDAGDIEGVTAGDGLSGGGTSGTVSLALDLNELTAAAVDVANDSIAIVDANDSNGSKKESIADLVTAMAGTNLTATNGVLSSTADLTGVTAGDGLSGGGTSGAITVALDLNELTAATVDVANDSIAIIDAGDSSSKKEAISDLASGMAGTNITASSGTLGMADEVIQDIVGAMVSSNTESGITVAYEDGDGTIDFTVGTLNQDTTGNAASATQAYVTNSDGDGNYRIVWTTGTSSGNSALLNTGGVTLNASTNVLTAGGGFVGDLTGDVTGNVTGNASGTALTVTQAAQTAITSVGTLTALAVDNISIDGNNIASTDSNGVINLSPNGTGNVVANTDQLVVQATEGEAASILLQTDEGDDSGDDWVIDNSTSNVLSFTNDASGSAVAHFQITPHATVGSSTAAFPGHVTVAGDLTITGATTTASSTNTTIADTLIELGNGTSGTPSNDSGFVIERGSADNAFIGFDESADKFIVGTGSFTGASTGNLTISTGTLVANVEGNLTGNVTGNVTGNTSGTAATVTTAAQPNITSLGTLTTLTVDDMTLNGSTISDAGDFTLDVGGDITFDADGNQIFFKDNGTQVGTLSMTDGNLKLISDVDDKDMIFAGQDGTSEVIALTFDMSNAGAATFNSTIASGAHTITNATNAGGTARNVYQSTSAPTGGDGAVGDLWILYA